MGATKIAGGLVDQTGTVHLRQSIPTAAERAGRAVFCDAAAMARDLQSAAANAGLNVAGLGLSICELVDPSGRVTSNYTVDWRDLPVQETLRQVAPQVVVEADVRAHALAEATVGAGRGLDSFVFVSVGSGISSCLVQGGRPFAGAHGNALVLATMPITVFDANEQKVEFALEAFASGIGLANRYRRYRPDVTRVETIVEDARHGSAVASAILRTGGEALGSALAWLVNVLDPAAVIVGGGLGMVEGLYWQSAVATARSQIFAAASRELPIVHSRCGADAGIIGAAIKALTK